MLFPRAALVLLASALTPVPETSDPPGAFVEGTQWRGKSSSGEKFDVRFDPGGHLHYDVGSGGWDTGTWLQSGTDVHMETNNHYADYHGVIQGDVIVGTAHNVAGLHWTWILQRANQ